MEAAPLDAQLHLPQRQYSYLLQQWLGSFVVDDAHAEAIRKLETILGLEITVRAVGGPQPRAGQRCRGVSRPSSGSGRRRGRTALGGDSGLQRGTSGAQGAAAGRGDRPPPPLPTLANPRRGKGEKANKKKMAAVGAVYTIEPFVRTADDVIEEVMRKKARKSPPQPAEQTGVCGVVGGQGGVVLVVGG